MELEMTVWNLLLEAINTCVKNKKKHDANQRKSSSLNISMMQMCFYWHMLNETLINKFLAGATV